MEIEKILKGAAGWLGKLADTGKTLARVALAGRRRNPLEKKNEPSGPLIILANGPSLRRTLDEEADKLKAADLMAVNFAANTPEFFSLKPKFYVLADPHFLTASDTDSNVGRLRANLQKVDWPMTLLTPENFHLTPGEGFLPVIHNLYKKGLAMPRPRNVLIPAIMLGIQAGYKEIYIVGADHTWPHTLYVDDKNRVVSVQPHFYEEDPKELDRIAEVYKGLYIDDVLGSMVVAFKSYHKIWKRKSCISGNHNSGKFYLCIRCLPSLKAY